MRRTVLLSTVLAFVAAGCGLLGAAPPPPPPSVAEARSHLELLIDAGVSREFDRLCELAGTGTCESLLEGSEELAPAEAPRIVDVTVHQPERLDAGSSSGGVLFVLCGTDAAGSPFESEVFVSRNSDGSLFAISAVWWTGTGVTISGESDGVTVGVEPIPGSGRCG